MSMSYLYCPNPDCGVYMNAGGQDFTEWPCDVCGYFEEKDEEDD